MKRHQFVLVVSGIDTITSELADELYTATGGDIEFNMRNGIAYLEFSRSAKNLQEAISSAIRDVQKVRKSFRVERVESETAHTIAKINAELFEAAGLHS